MSEYFYVVTVELNQGPRTRTYHGSVTPEVPKWRSAADAEDLYYAVMNDVYKRVSDEVGYLPTEQVAREIVQTTLMYHVQPISLGEPEE